MDLLFIKLAVTVAFVAIFATINVFVYIGFRFATKFDHGIYANVIINALGSLAFMAAVYSNISLAHLLGIVLMTIALTVAGGKLYDASPTTK